MIFILSPSLSLSLSLSRSLPLRRVSPSLPLSLSGPSLAGEITNLIANQSAQD